MKKRQFALFLTLILACFAMFPFSVMAETETTEEDTSRLSYTDNREDYGKLSDAQFANFRSVSTKGMGKNILYRSASPINPEHERNSYADAELKKYKVTVIMNLSDTRAEAEDFEDFTDTYYARTKHVYMSMPADVTSEEFGDKLGRGLRYFVKNHGIYAIHGEEGKDRTGFVAAILECFMGATAQEVVTDYMKSYYNYYGIGRGHAQYDSIAQSNIVDQLSTAFGLEDFYTADLKAGATAYLKKAGLSDRELTILNKNLKGENHTPIVKNKKSASYKSAGYTGDTYCKSCGKFLKKGTSISRLKAKAQTIKVSRKASKKVVIKSKSIRRKSKSFKISAKAKGAITYKVTRGKKKYISVSKSGKVVIKKKAKKGKYRITVYAAATSDGQYKKAEKVVKITVK